MLGKLASMVGLGKIASTRDDAPVRVAQVRLSEIETRDQTPMLQQYGFSSRPHPGADTAHICLNGDRSRMVIIATHDQRYFVSLVEGEMAIHDDQGQSIHITRTGIVINGGGRPVSITNTPTTTVSGDLVVVGNITDLNGLHGTMGALRSAYDNHTHPGIQPGGSSTGTTSLPV